MIDIPVSSVMEPIPSQPPAATLSAVAATLRKPDVPAVVVCEESGEPIGVVTESDVVAVVAESGGELPAESFMSSPVVSTTPATPIGIAADRMRDAGVKTVVVIDADDSYRGLVTRDALAPSLSRSRLDIHWQREPLSLAENERTGTPGAADARSEDAVTSTPSK